MATQSRCLTLTTINPPNRILEELADGARRTGIPFFIAGDTKSPPDFTLDGSTFLTISDQERRYPEFAAILPTRHYARKNIAYLEAMTTGCEWIQETDDDNLPLAGFWDDIAASLEVAVVSHPSGWVNAYASFTSKNIWPRGFPLDLLHGSQRILTTGAANTPGRIRQGLADANPDVDAVYRLAHTLPFDFEARSAIMPMVGQWCPFNSQNTFFHRDVFPLLYLPSYCSFRMTDIWRSFVAQRCLWELGENVVFHSATVRQERNDHDLMKDFADEIPGYLNNRAICNALAALELAGKPLVNSLRGCYQCLVDGGWLPDKELPVLEAWLGSCQSVLNG